MAFFKTGEEKLKERVLKQREEQEKHDAFVAAHGDRFCLYFSSPTKDLAEYEFRINVFLSEYPEYKIVTMTSQIGPLGSGIICYFEKTPGEHKPAYDISSEPVYDISSDRFFILATDEEANSISQKEVKAINVIYDPPAKKVAIYPYRPKSLSIPIVCPFCGMVQRPDVNECCECGAKFTFKDTEKVES